MRKLLKAVKYLLVAVYALCGVALAVFMLPKTGWKALNVATGSMTPAIPQGSLVLIHKVPYDQMHPGDVITYKNPHDPLQTITHRVVAAKSVANLPGFVTRGDANNADDTPIVAGSVAGKVVWHAPKLGGLLLKLKQPIWLILLVIMPGLIIIIDELRRLVRVLSNKEEKVRPVASPRAPSAEFYEAINPNDLQVSKPRSIDGILRAVFLLVVASSVVGVTRAQLSSTVTLTNNSIQTFTKANHLLIQRINLNGTASCPSASTNISITNTGQGSTNTATITDVCTIVNTTSTNVSITNTNNQTATSGNATGTNATSGSTSNTNNTTTTVNVGTGSGSSTPTSGVLLYNPTSSPVIFTGWTLTDDSGVPMPLPTTTIAAGGFVGVTFTGTLLGTGDRMILRNPSATPVDAVSWGTDTSQLNPSVPAFTNAISRKTLGLNTDTASDWQVE